MMQNVSPQTNIVTARFGFRDVELQVPFPSRAVVVAVVAYYDAQTPRALSPHGPPKQATVAFVAEDVALTWSCRFRLLLSSNFNISTKYRLFLSSLLG